MNHLWQYGMLTDNQHVFRAKRSTETQFICTIHEIASAIQSNKTTHTVVLDFSKAFDKLPHRRLFTKLGYYGIRGSLLNRFESFLTQCTSVPVPVQGPHLLLESRHLASEGNGLRAVTVLDINDSPDGLNSKGSLFADDALFYETICCEGDVQVDLFRSKAWQQKSKMEFNSSRYVKV